jgi:hypothetical protein
VILGTVRSLIGVAADFKSYVTDLEKTVHTGELRFQQRVLRQLKNVRKRLTADV